MKASILFILMVMDAKCRWCHICAKEKLESVIPDHLEGLLPEGYSHFICSYTPLHEGFICHLKLQLDTREDAEAWLEDFQQSSTVTLRVLKTYPNTEEIVRRNSYRVDMRCQHNTRNPLHTKKNTHCLAGLNLVLKKNRESLSRESRSRDAHRKEGLLLHVCIKHNHNHPLDSVEALQHRDVARDTVEKLKTLFYSGHSPASALHTLKYELQEELGDAYQHALVDRSICPDVGFCYRLYYSIFKRKCREAPREAVIEDIQEQLEVYSSQESPQDEAGSTTPPPSPDPGAKKASLRSELEHLEGQLRSIVEVLVDKLKEDETFRSPVESFVSSFRKIHTDSGLISALSTFGRARSSVAPNI